jgi:O-antigen/teichoic acid export membrane protein
MSSQRPNIGQSSLVKNSLLNLTGLVLPALVALVAIPVCIHVYGNEQFGLLSLAWTFFVAFGYLDVGTGISTAKYAAEMLRKSQRWRIPTIVWTSVGINLALGISLAVFLSFAAPTLTDHFIRPSSLLRGTTISLVVYSGISLPFITSSGALRGALEASNRFDLSNGIRVPSLSLLFLIPALGGLAGLPLDTVVLFLSLSRILTAITFLYFVAKLFPEVIHSFSFELSQAKALFRFGSWVSITNILNPVIMQSEKLLIPAILSVGMLTYYSPPQEMVARIAIIPVSLSVAMLPKFSYLGKQDTLELREQVVIRPIQYVLILMAPLMGVFIFFSKEIMSAWVGTALATISKDVLVVLAGAYFFSGLSAIPLSAVQGLGHPDLKAKWDLVLAPSFVLLAVLSIRSFGIMGAAISRFVVLSADSVYLFLILKKVLSLPAEEFFPMRVRIMSFSGVGFLGIGAILSFEGVSLALRLSAYLCSLLIFAILVWKKGMKEEERKTLRRTVSMLQISSLVHPAMPDEQT